MSFTFRRARSGHCGVLRCGWAKRRRVSRNRDKCFASGNHDPVDKVAIQEGNLLMRLLAAAVDAANLAERELPSRGAAP